MKACYPMSHHILMRFTLVVLVAMAAWLARGEDLPKPEPQTTTEQKLDYQRARANLAAVKEQNAASEAAAQKVLQEAIQAMIKTCGDRMLVEDQKKDPVCAGRPAEKEK